MEEQSRRERERLRAARQAGEHFNSDEHKRFLDGRRLH